MKKIYLLLLAFFSIVISSFAQVGINSDNSTPHSAAMLDVKSSDKGFLPPRMTTEQMNGVVSPPDGLIVYNTSVSALYWFNGSIWKKFNEFSFTETDPVFLVHPSHSITTGNISDWNTAFGWGNHANAGYLTSFTESDPIFGMHPASGITSVNINNWSTAYSWGNHALAGYLTSFTETDPIFGLHPASGITSGNINNWNTAYSWGNHANAGYLTSFTETDPIFSLHPASGVTNENINNWNTAYNNRITSASGTTPLSLNIVANQLSGSMTPANTSSSGYLTSSDWNTFSNKQNALSFGNVNSSDMAITGGNGAVIGSGMSLTINKGSLTSSDLNITGGSNAVLGAGTSMTIKKSNLTEATSSVLTITGGSNAVLGTGTTIQVKQATSSQSGYLSSTDWNTFNNKQSTLTFGNLTSSDITVTGGSGAVLGSGATLAVNKGNLTETGSSVLTITNGSNVVLGTGSSIQVKQANTTQSGYLSSSDFNNFNNKVSSQWVSSGQNISYNSGKVAVGTAAPASSAIVDLTSTTNGFLMPRMTMDQRDAISNPAEGLMVFCTNCGSKGTLSVFANGSWSTFSPCTSPVPTPITNVVTPNQVIWKWNASPGATGYKWGTTTNYTAAEDLNMAISKTETGTICDSTYTRYLWSYNVCGVSERVTLTQTISGSSPVTPIAASHVATTNSVVWKWHPVSGATGYKWSMNNNFSAATDLGTDTTKTETGDTCGTVYTRYVWAYNGCGFSTPLTLTQSTIACWVCGTSTLTINHVAGSVAPVNKTTTYGTVTNIPGEESKCWITSNLGSDQQATSVDDATEASAGWYWQFNRKQGYKHDGTTRTPNTTWITSISENSDWLIANDPCNLELETAWRLPTYTEWFNVDNIGGWTNWNGPWDSGLKLHVAGALSYSNGSVYDRGSTVSYWSSTPYGTDGGYALGFGSSYSIIFNGSKAYGFTVRCLR